MLPPELFQLGLKCGSVHSAWAVVVVVKLDVGLKRFYIERNHPPIQNRTQLDAAPICSGGHPACRIRRHLAARAAKPKPRHDLASTSKPGWKPGDTAAKMAAATGQYPNAPIQNLRFKKDFHSCRRTSMFCCIQSL
jgi:hypothetical protein